MCIQLTAVLTCTLILATRLTPIIDTDSKDTGPDSWCACVLDVLDAAQVRPLLNQSILNRLSHRMWISNMAISASIQLICCLY